VYAKPNSVLRIDTQLPNIKLKNTCGGRQKHQRSLNTDKLLSDSSTHQKKRKVLHRKILKSQLDNALKSLQKKTTGAPKQKEAFGRKNFSVDNTIRQPKRRRGNVDAFSPKRVFSEERINEDTLDAPDAEVFRWCAIHKYISERIQTKLTHARMARFRGLVSPQLLNRKLVDNFFNRDSPVTADSVLHQNEDKDGVRNFLRHQRLPLGRKCKSPVAKRASLSHTISVI
jgi:hypothetical protein